MSTQTLQPLIWLARSCTSWIVVTGTLPFSAVFPNASSACRASGITMATFFIRDFMDASFVSHQPPVIRHTLDEAERENVTDGRQRLAGGTIRGKTRPPARRGVPDARLARRGGRCGAGSVAAAQPVRRERCGQPRRVADDGRRARVSRHAALAQVAPRRPARRRGGRPPAELY